MPFTNKPFVQLAIEQVDTVIHDPEGRYDAESFDRYETFEAARDAALTSIEVMFDEADYDGEDHLDELTTMHRLLESASTFDDLEAEESYAWFLSRLAPVLTAAS